MFITTRTQKSSITFYLTDTSMSSPQPEPTIVVFTIYTIQLPCNHLLRHAKRIIGAILLPPPQYPALPPPSYILVLVPVVTFSIWGLRANAEVIVFYFFHRVDLFAFYVAKVLHVFDARWEIKILNSEVFYEFCTCSEKFKTPNKCWFEAVLDAFVETTIFTLF